VSLALPPWAIVGERRQAHIARVTGLVGSWATAMGVPTAEADRWRTAAALHDALRDAKPAELARWAPQDDWPLALWHGPAAAAASEADGIDDGGLLAAIRYHSVGWLGWDRAGQMLFMADFLEPGRSYYNDDLAALAARVPLDPDRALREVVERRVLWARAAGKTLRPETEALWASLA